MLEHVVKVLAVPLRYGQDMETAVKPNRPDRGFRGLAVEFAHCTAQEYPEFFLGARHLSQVPIKVVSEQFCVPGVEQIIVSTLSENATHSSGYQ